MDYRWDDAQEQKIAIESKSMSGSDELALLVYLSNLIGGDGMLI